MPTTAATRYAFLGPEGTFAEMALLQLPGAADAVRRPMASVDAALDAVRDGSVDAAMVPIENSVEGGVTATLDSLAAGAPLVVLAEALVPITFHLVARPGTVLADVTRVSSHTHAIAQCRGWLHRTMPEATVLPALSTAGAAAGLLDPDVGYDAALCAPVAGERYGLEVLARDVGDNPTAVTRFVLVSRPVPPPAATGADKTTLAAYLADDHPGALLELLEQFAVRGINLTRLESRPTGDRMGRYYMSIDAEGHVSDARLAEAVKSLHRVCAAVRYLGSYPRADAAEPAVAPENSAKAFADAEQWFAGLLAGDVG